MCFLGSAIRKNVNLSKDDFFRPLCIRIECLHLCAKTNFSYYWLKQDMLKIPVAEPYSSNMLLQLFL